MWFKELRNFSPAEAAEGEPVALLIISTAVHDKLPLGVFLTIFANLSQVNFNQIIELRLRLGAQCEVDE